MPFRHTDIYIDLGAQSPLGAVKGGRTIAVEIKSFRGASEIHDLEQAVGQYRLYRFALARQDSERVCFLAISSDVHRETFSDAEALDFIASEDIRLVVFDIQ